jgi:hypothetical protein
MFVLLVTLSQEIWCHHSADRYARVGSNLTLAKVAQAKMEPDAMPKDYHEVLKEVLANYASFLQQMLSTQCNHFVEVHNLTKHFKNMMARMVVTVTGHLS